MMAGSFCYWFSLWLLSIVPDAAYCLPTINASFSVALSSALSLLAEGTVATE